MSGVATAVGPVLLSFDGEGWHSGLRVSLSSIAFAFAKVVAPSSIKSVPFASFGARSSWLSCWTSPPSCETNIALAGVVAEMLEKVEASYS